jgi:hypothetical protein
MYKCIIYIGVCVYVYKVLGYVRVLDGKHEGSGIDDKFVVGTEGKWWKADVNVCENYD